MNLMSTLKGSLMEGFLPAGWDLARIDRCASQPPDEILKRQPWWQRDFQPVACASLEEFGVLMGHEIALEICRAAEEKRELILILPVGPMGMYRWTVHFLKEWGVDCRHVHGFNMDEWSDRAGNTLPADHPGAFQKAMEDAFYGPLGRLGVPRKQRHFARRDQLPAYPEEINRLRKRGARMSVVFGIGRVFHIAFWEPHFAAEFKSEAAWRRAEYRLAARLHPLTIEQNAITSFKSRTTLVPAFANTIGPGIFLKADRIIGGCDGALGRGMMWQGMSLWVTLRYGPDIWVPSSFMPTRPGRLFFLKELAGPLTAECN
ncbi:MAG TPA: glucosamine-6-phosphate isomerase [bacterium]|uniref:Glucosamine-6-phosphate deaminase n=1 Tax=candidate division TA06 bacterium ADurb.Bin417 TaxID=1852828 RepID=A0A1V5MHQ6_UNCT6|nr:MAG: Glucosamine-6-phosphate deaminase [candidate division TA06 bacterium ADurb.Bin417]HNQ35210.1 glucosamine-6-phosphate isomerase [bacterium]HNS49054.1 glucosamine-6-phosphate isomerase [bacterium]